MFSVIKSDESTAAVVIDGTVDNTSLSISIIGRNIDDYAQNIAENHLHIMENFAKDTPPAAPTRGQLWFNTNAGEDRLYVLNTSLSWEKVVQVERDETPKLGGQLDVNGFALGDGTNKLLDFVEDASAVNYIEIENEATGSGPIIRPGGADTNTDLILEAKGIGNLVFSSLRWPTTDGTSGQVLTSDGTGNLSFTTIGATGIGAVVDDLTPQLGGNLDVKGKSIVSVSAGNIAITPDTTGKIILDGLSWPIADGTLDQILRTDGSGSLSFVDNDGSTALQNVVEDTAPQLGGQLNFDTFSIGDGTDEVLSFAASPGAVNEITIQNALTTTAPKVSATGTDVNVALIVESKGSSSVMVGAPVLSGVDAAPASGNTGPDLIIRGAAGDGGGDGGDLTLQPGAGGGGGVDGLLILDGLTWPAADGTSGQTLITNGAGVLSFSSISAIANVVEDSTPQLGGNLDINGKSIVSVSAGNINITPDTSGAIVLDGLSWPTGDGTSNQVLTTDGFGALSFASVAGDFADDIFRIQDDGDATKEIAFQASGITTGTVRTITMPDNDVNLGTDFATAAQGTTADSALQTLSDDPSPSLSNALNCASWAIIGLHGISFSNKDSLSLRFNGDTNTGFYGGGDIFGIVGGAQEITKFYGTDGSSVNFLEIKNSTTGNPVLIGVEGTDTNVDLNLEAKGTGNVVISSLSYPNADGNAGEALITDGAGSLSFTEMVPVTTFTVTTTDATQTTIASISVISGTSLYFTIKGHGRENATGDTKGSKIEGIIENTGGTTVLVGSLHIIDIDSAGAASWDITAVANDTTDALDIKVTGEAAHTIDWRLRVETIEE